MQFKFGQEIMESDGCDERSVRERQSWSPPPYQDRHRTIYPASPPAPDPVVDFDGKYSLYGAWECTSPSYFVPYDKEKVNYDWAGTNILMVGDDRARMFDMSTLNDASEKTTPSQIFAVKENAQIFDIEKLVNDNINDDITLIVVFTFHSGITKLHPIKNGDSKSSILVIDNDAVNAIDEWVKYVSALMIKWSQDYPNTKVLWTLPYPPDFERYNKLLLKGVENPLSSMSQMDFGREYYKILGQLLKIWKSNLPKVPYFNLTETLFANYKTREKKYSPNKKCPLNPPNDRTIDGINPSSSFIYWFRSHLKLKLMISKVLPYSAEQKVETNAGDFTQNINDDFIKETETPVICDVKIKPNKVEVNSEDDTPQPIQNITPANIKNESTSDSDSDSDGGVVLDMETGGML